MFGDDIAWPSSSNNNSNKHLDSTASSGVGPNEMYDISSSPTSSVSSSKVELTTYFDNDSGVGGSNPLDMTPTSLHEPPSGGGGGYNDQAPYLETNLDTQSWYQARSAYSAPSSPALPRNSGEHAHNQHRSRGSSPRSAAMRSHPSMDGINNRAWPRTQPPSTNGNSEGDASWKMSAFRNPSSLSTLQLDSSKVVRSPTEGKSNNNNNNNNHDSGLSSPHMTSSSSSLTSTSADRETRRPPPSSSTKNTPATEEGALKQVTASPMSKSWSAERFQDVRTLSDLMKQLSLDKYTAKLEVC